MKKIQELQECLIDGNGNIGKNFDDSFDIKAQI